MRIAYCLALFFLVILPAAAQQDEPSPSLGILAQRVDQDERWLADWPQLARYREENIHTPAPAAGETRVVFMGDSITDFWGRGPDRGVFFPGKPYFNRGIGGQTTPQMLVRFRADVIALHPRVVVILAGTNDIAGNTGKATQAMIEDNIASMCDLARANDIKVVLSSLLPVNDLVYPDETTQRPPARIRELNDWLRQYAGLKGFVYLDYYSALVDNNGALNPSLSNDGLHPNSKGYAVMAPLAQRAIDQALRQ
jgi:lysophospholipase L1-like esterase